MRIDAQKPIRMIAALALAYAGVACVSVEKGDKESRVIPLTTPTPSRIVPQICATTPSEMFRPPQLEQESVVIYPGGILVNRAGSILDLSVNVPNLLRINHDPKLNLGFTQDTVNIVYLYDENFAPPGSLAKIKSQIERDKLYLIYRYCQEQGLEKGIMRFVVISVADQLTELKRRNQQKYLPTDSFWKNALEVELANVYVAITRARVKDSDDLPLQAPALSADDRATLKALDLPFRITRLDLIPLDQVI